MAKQPKSAIKLPPMLAEIADVIGLDTTIRLAAALGGARVYIPANLRRIRPGNPLVEVVGREAANRLCQHFASDRVRGLAIVLPLLPKTIAVHVLTALGKTSREIARQLYMSQRRVHANRSKKCPVDGLTLEPVGATRRAVFKQLGLTDEDVRRYGAETL